MVSVVLTVIIVIGMMGRFYLKFSPLKSFMVLICSIIGVVVAFSYYESLSGLLVSKGILVQSAQAMCFFVLYLITSLGLEYVLDYIVGSKIDFGNPAKISSAVILGALTGVIISGMFVTFLGLLPMRRMIPYSRFGDSIQKIKSPSKTIIPCDDFVAGIYKLVSNGFSSKNRFDVVHANFLDKIHLNRFMSKEKGVLADGHSGAFNRTSHAMPP